MSPCMHGEACIVVSNQKYNVNMKDMTSTNKSKQEVIDSRQPMKRYVLSLCLFCYLKMRGIALVCCSTICNLLSRTIATMRINAG